MARRTALVSTCPSVLVAAGDTGERRGAVAPSLRLRGAPAQRTGDLGSLRGEQ